MIISSAIKSVFAYIRSIETQIIEFSDSDLSALSNQTLKELEKANTNSIFSPSLTTEENHITIKWQVKDYFVKSYGLLLSAFGVLFCVSIFFSFILRDVHYLYTGILGVLFVVFASRFTVFVFRLNARKDIEILLN